MFDYQNFIKEALMGAVGSMPDYKIRLNAAGWCEKDVLTTSDLADIQNAIDAKNAVATEETNENNLEEGE